MEKLLANTIKMELASLDDFATSMAYSLTGTYSQSNSPHQHLLTWRSQPFSI